MITDKKYLLFDLDGTLTDPKVGICTCVQYALKAFGIDEPDLDKLEPFIGPPLKDSFMQYYGLSEEQAVAAIEKYRERFSVTGKFENEVYEGIPELLSDLKDYGYHLAVASSKPECFVKDILNHFKISKYFEAIVGSELDGSRIDKAEVIHEALNQLFHYGKIRKSQVVMIGDRKFDVEGAKEINVTSVAVAYGYGSLDELRQAQPDYLAESVDELRNLFMEEAELEDKRQEARKKEAEELKEAQIAAAAAQRAQYEGNHYNTVKSTEPDEQDAPKGIGSILWKLAYPILLFYFGSKLIGQAVGYIVSFVSQQSESLYHFLVEEDATTGELFFSANASAIISMVSLVAAFAFMYKIGGGKISLARGEEPKLKFRGADWFRWLMMAISLAIGINIVFASLGFLSVTGYQETADNLYSVGMYAGLLLYGVFSPITEELVFRGILFNESKTFMKPSYAAILSAALFGFYHGNIVQMIYGLALGLILAYAYHYSGQFIVPVVLHAVVNVVVYVSSILGMFPADDSQMVTGIVLLAIGIWLFSQNRRGYAIRREQKLDRM